MRAILITLVVSILLAGCSSVPSLLYKIEIQQGNIITQEMVDKVIALGLIDVRDIEEVGTGPLMEELGLSEEVAQTVVEKCAEEAKIVASEQEAKRAAEASAKASGGGPNALERALAGETAAASEETAADTDAANRMPGAMEATEGGAPETVTHAEPSIADSDELSPEETAVHPENPSDVAVVAGQQAVPDDENSEVAALAEGRTSPPIDTRQDPQV